ncbi:flagellar assembly peptidoglycan hydrolase FlgJ [Lacimicrobium alkaliphilum]|uniref:Peptidoglycan hydrolase FlgJ n=1 Tax=Lacimicrobium alkaliphilum TaxID=1526571 RepID=A0ABQ1RM80_9ALTE|nr:flagellar assembly peptidoglycan hydrolase FlgJ [Lacimicrobium alkaliphilum]GGD72274.1 peptidoglycan hydrolase FlgJ [Lacimicrobium alkaliphilum]
MEQRYSIEQLQQSRNVHDLKGLDTLRKAAVSGDKNALEEAAKQFEGIFVRMMLKSMRDAQDVLSDEDSPFNSEQVKFYRDMHDQQLATDISASGTMGLADLIIKQLGQNVEGYQPAQLLRNDGNLSSINRQRLQNTDTAQQQVLGGDSITGNKLPGFNDAKAFVDSLLPHAQRIGGQIGLDGRALVAQAALETGWGQQMIHLPSGQNSHNLFGIKASKGWQGDKALVDTLEYRDGLPKSEKAPFRAYESFADSMQDYVDFVRDNPRYAQAMQKTDDPETYFRTLQQSGYATDPQYADKVLKLLNGDLLGQSHQAQNLHSDTDQAAVTDTSQHQRTGFSAGNE